jgi:hypothetical protein
MPVKSKLRLVTPAIENRAVAPRRPKNAELRRREHLTPAEVERMIEAAKNNRHGHRDAPTFDSGKVRGASNIRGLSDPERGRGRNSSVSAESCRGIRRAILDVAVHLHRLTRPQLPPAQSARRQSFVVRLNDELCRKALLCSCNGFVPSACGRGVDAMADSSGRALGQCLRKTELGHDLGCEKFKLFQGFVARNQSPVEEPNQVIQRYFLQ